MHKMITLNNVQLQAEVKSAKKHFGTQIWAKWAKIGVKISLFYLHCLAVSKSKTHGKNFGGCKLGSKLWFLPFYQGCIISFP